MTPLRGVALSVLVALSCAVWSVCTISLSPPGIEPRQVEIGAAATHLLVDSERSWILDEFARSSDFDSLGMRAELYATLIASPPVREIIARRMNLPTDRVAAVARITAGVPDNLRDPTGEQRANQILVSKERYRLDLQSDPVRPVLNVYAQAPSVAEATRLADASIAALREHLRDRAVAAGVDPRRQVRLDQLGRARGGVVNGGVAPQIAILTFVLVFGICCFVLLAGARVRRGWTAASAQPGSEPSLAYLDEPRTDPGGNWPRTSRFLPWMIAFFMAVIWLTPFNTIELTASLPFDLQLDRIILPVIIGTWILALAAGGPDAPRIRLTGMHAGIVGFVAVTCVGVLLGALALNQTLELELATKKLTLLFLYLLLFVMVASIVRRAEAPAFFKYTLGLAVLCGLGTVWEYRFEYNVFYDLADKWLPAMFEVGAAEAGLADGAGRYLTRGPGEHPLEAVSMMCLALPIALVGVLQSPERRSRILYGLAACVLIAAAISTYRKSALLAPVSVCLTLAYFRRHELLRLAPAGVVFVVVIQLLAPGAANSILYQLQPDQLGVGTVSDRASDYDAVRPDLWTNLLFGRGYGTYDHNSYRILDSEILNRIVDTGLLGVLALVAMLVSMIVAARPLIRARHPVWTAPALSLAPAAVSFLVLCFLFDISSFPHAPYILMTIAGFYAAIVARSPEEEDAREPPPARTPVHQAPRELHVVRHVEREDADPRADRVPDPVGR